MFSHKVSVICETFKVKYKDTYWTLKVKRGDSSLGSKFICVLVVSLLEFKVKS